MKKILLFLALSSFLVIPSSVFAQVNIDFTINIEDKIYYPNEKILVNVSIINRDLNFVAKDAVLTIIIGDRIYDFKIGDLKTGSSFIKEITLPEFTPGSYTIKGVLNYSGFFEGREIIETYNGYEVRFPEIVRYPRNVNVIGFNLPDKIIAGKSYNVSVVIKNEGDIGGDMIIEVASLEEFADEETYLGPGDTKTVDLDINFRNTEVSLIEARVYALINDERYLLVYSGKKAYIEPERVAKLSFDKLELFEESDNEINQNDEVKLKIYIKNSGNYPATNAQGTLKSTNTNLNILSAYANYSLIQNGESIANQRPYILKTQNADVGDHNLILELNYEDSDKHSTFFDVLIATSSGGDRCVKDNDCGDDETCKENRCQAVGCDCGYVKGHKCVKYECCSDSDCETECDKKLHVCKSPQCIKDIECADNEICTLRGKCQKAFTLVVVPLGIESQDVSRYLEYSNNELLFFRDTSPLRESQSSQSKNLRIHYINPSLCQQDTECTYQSSNHCYEEMTKCARRSSLLGIADKLVGIIDKNIGVCGFAPMGGFHSINKLGCKGTPAHEIGHNLDLGHINCIANDIWTCIQPNVEDCNESDKATDIMSYCSEDHYGPQAYIYMKQKYFQVFLEESK